MSYFRNTMTTSLLGVLLVGCFVLSPVGASYAAAAEETAAKHEEPADGAKHDDKAGTTDDEHDAHGDHELPPILSANPGSAVVNLMIFLLTFALLAKFVWPVILGGLQAREEKIASDLRQAEQSRDEAQKSQAEYEAKLSEAATEAQTILSDARRDAEASAAKIVDEAKADAKRQGDRALADIETAKKVALAEIADQTSGMAISVAKQVVGREIKADDHAELISKALKQVPGDS